MAPFELRDLILTVFLAVLGLGTILPLARALARRIADSKRPAAPALGDADRMARLEQAIEAISVEVERIAEGQRFVTRVLSEADKAKALPVPR